MISWSLRSQCAVIACLLLPPQIAVAQSPTPVEQLVTQIQDALLIVSKSLSREALPALEQAELTLHTKIARKLGVGFEFLVITIGGEVSDEEVQTIILTLKPPSPATEQPSAAGDFSKALADAIVAAARGVQPALTREPKLGLAKLDATLSFAIQREGQIGAQLIFVPITVKLGGGMSKNHLHKVKLVYSQSK